MSTCIFCKIVKGEAPCYKIYEDEKYLAFLDIFPYVKGHVLLIPKKHYRWLYDLPEADFKEIWGVGQKMALALKKAFQPEFVSLVTYGLDVFHAHINLLPRDQDQQEFLPRERITFTKEDFSKIAQQIKDVIK